MLVRIDNGTLAGQEVVPWESTWRWNSISIGGEWHRATWWGLPFSVCGQGIDSGNSIMIPCSGIQFSGNCVRIRVTMQRLYVSNASHNTMHYAVQTVRADRLYQGRSLVNAVGELATGLVTSKDGDNVFDFYCSVESGQPFYLYFWRDGSRYGNWHIQDNTIIQIFSAQGQDFTWRDAAPFVYDGEWKQASAHIFDSRWKNA